MFPGAAEEFSRSGPHRLLRSSLCESPSQRPRRQRSSPLPFCRSAGLLVSCSCLFSIPIRRFKSIMLPGICQGHFYAKARLYLRLSSDKACFYTLFRCYSPNFALWIVAVISLCHTPTRNAVKRYAQSTSNVMIAHTATQIFRWFFQSLRILPPPFRPQYSMARNKVSRWL